MAQPLIRRDSSRLPRSVAPKGEVTNLRHHPDGRIVTVREKSRNAAGSVDAITERTGRVSPDSPLSCWSRGPAVRGSPQNLRPCECNHQKPMARSRASDQPNRPAIDVVTTSAIGAGDPMGEAEAKIQPRRGVRRRPIQAAWPSDTSRRSRPADSSSPEDRRDEIWLPRLT